MQGLRISGGTLRGRKLRIDPKAGVRPTSERARQAYFNIVGGRIAGARFLDLYAGSGVFAFEAVSRGADEALALDLSRKNVESISRFASEWGVSVRAETLRLPDGLAKLADAGTFDLVYADPPYNAADYGEILSAIDRMVPLASDSMVAIEHRSKANPDIPERLGHLLHLRTNAYGNVSISFFDLREPSEHE